MGGNGRYKQLFLVISEIMSLNRHLVQMQGGGLSGGRSESFLQVLYFSLERKKRAQLQLRVRKKGCQRYEGREKVWNSFPAIKKCGLWKTPNFIMSFSCQNPSTTFLKMKKTKEFLHNSQSHVEVFLQSERKFERICTQSQPSP